MSNFTLIITDLPLASLNLNCLSDSGSSPGRRWKVGESAISEGGKWGLFNKILLKRLYPGKNIYFSWYPLNTDLVDLAREYLDHDDRIIFHGTQFHPGNRINWRMMRRLKKEFLIDITHTPPGSMPIIDGNELMPDAFDVYTIIKQRE